MTLTIDATAGGADANSYGVIADVNASAPFRPVIGTAWLAASGTPDLQAQCCVMATDRIDQLRFGGEPASDGQALQFPRANLRDRYCRTVDSGSIPRAVLEAWKSLSMYYLSQVAANATTDPMALGQTQSIQMAKAGDAQVQYFAPSPVSNPTGWNDTADLPADVVRLLNQYLSVDPTTVDTCWGHSCVVRTS